MIKFDSKEAALESEKGLEEHPTMKISMKVPKEEKKQEAKPDKPKVECTDGSNKIFESEEAK